MRKIAIFASMLMSSISIFAGSFEIVRAEYGALDTWADVTNVVRNVLKDDTSTLTVNNENFGDPITGVPKNLCIIIRYQNREVILFGCESSTISLNNPVLEKASTIDPDLKNRVQVIKAEYGGQDKWLDVTENVKCFINKGMSTIEASNQNFTDPIQIVKQFWVAVKYNGRNVIVFAIEGKSVSLDNATLEKAADFDPAINNRVQIIKAEYGGQDKWLDVTENVKNQVSKGATAIESSNANFTDPIMNVEKTLRIKYKLDGKDMERSASEKNLLKLL